MNIDKQELKNVAEAGTPRMDLYGGIHKALRALMADTLVAVGRMDSTDDLELARTTERVLELLDFCTMHLTKENTYVHAAMEARAPGASEAIAHEHEDHVRHIDALSHDVAALRSAPAAQRHALQHELYADLGLFVAENLQHMRVEETAHNAVLWARYTDAELMAIHDKIVASIPPDQMLFAARWLVPAMCPVERAGLLGGMKAHAPAPVFEAVMATVKPHLTAIEWAKLENALA
ncbi:hemerythrin domain-containing protein [Ramlibacter albus]|uniref:Hemerythrin domain-containing protein n=1 Tax=Ramlibacter albus TaxID=2079448 RepID=A0A923M3H1_9BURK|nr:hemerythrin domain-containing protein [Ramlibacter albus]MBC5763245.1 hemerythrin domain-containing protein [Ramlibacter albus]